MSTINNKDDHDESKPEANSFNTRDNDTAPPPYDPLTINTSSREVAEGADIGTKVGSLLKSLSFPVYKHQIVNHLKRLRIEENGDVPAIEDISKVLEIIEHRLDAYKVYSSVNDVLRAAIVTENPEAYAMNLMSEKARTGGNFAVRSPDFTKSQKEKEAPKAEEERQDYPEVPPSSRMEFGCDICGVSYSSLLEMRTHMENVHGSSSAIMSGSPSSMTKDGDHGGSGNALEERRARKEHHLKSY